MENRRRRIVRVETGWFTHNCMPLIALRPTGAAVLLDKDLLHISGKPPTDEGVRQLPHQLPVRRIACDAALSSMAHERPQVRCPRPGSTVLHLTHARQQVARDPLGDMVLHGVILVPARVTRKFFHTLVLVTRDRKRSRVGYGSALLTLLRNVRRKPQSVRCSLRLKLGVQRSRRPYMSTASPEPPAARSNSGRDIAARKRHQGEHTLVQDGPYNGVAVLARRSKVRRVVSQTHPLHKPAHEHARGDYAPS